MLASSTCVIQIGFLKFHKKDTLSSIYVLFRSTARFKMYIKEIQNMQMHGVSTTLLPWKQHSFKTGKTDHFPC